MDGRARCDRVQTIKSRTFHSSYLDDRLNGSSQAVDFNPFDADQKLDNPDPAPTPSGQTPPKPTSFYTSSEIPADVESPLLKHVWDRAAEEWTGHFGRQQLPTP